MKLIDKLLVIAGKKDFKIDDKISTGYILRMCWKYGWMMIRGKIFSFGRHNISNSVFVGKRVKTLEKRYLHMGNQCKLHDNVYVDALSRDGVRLGDRVILGRGTGIKIGNDVVAGQFIRFHSENHNYEDMDTLIKDQGVNHKGIIVGDNCWIGSGVVFLDGASIANGCVVAANAVITKQFPENSIVGGVPAKIIGYRDKK